MIEHLESVSLDELVSQAALMHRVDRKYVLSPEEADKVIANLPSDSRVLDIRGTRSFKYRSTYFDTADLTIYLEAGYQFPYRYKIRTRSYVDTDDHFLEVKLRESPEVLVKRRQLHPKSRPDAIAPRDLKFINKALDQARVTKAPGELIPTLRTIYNRTTILLPSTSSRVTIDSRLRWAVPKAKGRHKTDRVIIETKTSGEWCEVDELLQSENHHPIRMSKYGVGMALLNPSLPWLKWYDVIRHYFGEVPSPQ